MFEKGKSGNPKGRPKGSRDKRLALMLSNEKRLQRKLVQMALGGDIRAMQLCADRLWPRLRPEAVPVKIKTTSSDLADTGRSVIAAALDGRVPVDAVRDLVAALYGQAKIVELTELEKRLAALENKPDKLPPWMENQRPKFPIRGKKRRAKNES